MPAFNLFTYGTLMQAELMSALLQQHIPAGTPATLDGYQRYRFIDSRNYPGLKISGTEQVEGILYQQLSQAQILRLDAYEGNGYERIKVTVESKQGQTHSAYCYLSNEIDHPLLSHEIWTP